MQWPSKRRIAAVSPIDAARQQFRAKTVVELHDHALMPGFVNAHTHAAMSLFRGMADDLPLMEWLNEHIWPAEGKVASERFVADGTRLAAAEMLLGGTTCFNDMYFFPKEGAAALDMGIRAVLGMIVLDFPTAFAQDSADYIARGIAVHDETRSQELLDNRLGPARPIHSLGRATRANSHAVRGDGRRFTSTSMKRQTKGTSTARRRRTSNRPLGQSGFAESTASGGSHDTVDRCRN